jgi:hypothetical protein
MAPNQPQIQQQQQHQPHPVPPQQQQQFYPNPAQIPNSAVNQLNAPNANQFQMNQNPLLAKQGPQQANQMIQPGVPSIPQQQFGFQNQADPQVQAYYNQQQQQQQPQGPMAGSAMGGVPSNFQQPQPGGINANLNNPYSKAPNQSLARPPSTTIYQQGYK